MLLSLVALAYAVQAAGFIFEQRAFVLPDTSVSWFVDVGMSLAVMYDTVSWAVSLAHRRRPSDESAGSDAEWCCAAFRRVRATGGASFPGASQPGTTSSGRREASARREQMPSL